MNSKFLKEYREKCDRIRKKEGEDEKKDAKKVLAEEKSISDVFEKYTDRPHESVEKSLFEYGILRNPKTGKTIIGVEKVGEKFTEFIFEYITPEEIIDEINTMDEIFFNKIESIIGSKEELIQAILDNENEISVIILLLMAYRDNKIYDMIENSRANSINLDMLIDMVENEVEIENQEIYEYKYNSDGEILEIRKPEKKIDIFPEAKKININVIDELPNYKVVYRDENGECRIFGICEDERIAMEKVEQVFENIKNRKHSSGAGLYIYTPFAFNGIKVKEITESKYISLKEEYKDIDEILKKSLK